MKNRLCIFSFFDKNGYVDDYVEYLLKELITCVSKLIIVVNGKLDSRGEDILLQFTDEVYVRGNEGFDAGSYKFILCHKLSMEEINSFDEVILCNDTFYGPFIPMTDVFDKMDNVDCDMWGLNGYVGWIYPHIQSYFIVFRDRIVKSDLLIDFFNNNIDESTRDIHHVYCQFENGIYDYMVRQNDMKSAQYVEDNCNYDLYKCSYAYLQEFKFPILKKKVFDLMYSSLNNAMCSLSYIKNNTNYDIELILKNIERVYGIAIKADDIKSVDSYNQPKVSTLITQVNSADQVEDFIRGEEFYIYGAGTYACNTYWRFGRGNNKFLGFIVSDNSKDADTLIFGKPVKKFSDVDNIYSKKVILGMKTEFALEVLKRFADTSKVMRIF